MIKISSAILVFLCLCNASAQTCERGRYSYLYKTYALNCKNITDQFPNTTNVASSISCENCNISVVTEKLVFKFSGDIFNLSNSHIKRISANAFKNFGNNTHKFLFMNNELSYIAPHVFDNFKNLEELNFKNNRLEWLPDGVFQGVSLTVLDLSENQISNVTNFINKLKVIKLNLSYNKINSIPSNTFNNTIFWSGNRWRNNFQELNLANNKIESIYPGSFQLGPESSIRTLYLQNNKLTVILNNTFSGINDLRTMNLESNNINILNSDSFSNLNSLTSLILENNKLEKIPVGTFSKLQHLESLNLASNQLQTLDSTLFSGLLALTRLNLANNNLKQLTPTHIFPLGKLINLDISGNKLRELDLKTIFAHHNRLRTITINDNFWTCSKLVEMYKIMNPKIGGFDHPTKHFDVPNLHGIACSRVELDYDEKMTFEEFMNVISQDRVFEDIYDSRINTESDITTKSYTELANKLNAIFWMFLLLTIMCSIIFIRFVVSSIFGYLKENKIIANKINFSYTRTQDDVQLL